MNTSDATPDTSKKFQNYMVETAKKLQKRIVLPEGEDKRILSAAAKLAEDGLAYLTILGEEKEVLARVDELGLTWNPERIQILLRRALTMRLIGRNCMKYAKKKA